MPIHKSRISVDWEDIKRQHARRQAAHKRRLDRRREQLLCHDRQRFDEIIEQTWPADRARPAA